MNGEINGLSTKEGAANVTNDEIKEFVKIKIEKIYGNISKQNWYKNIQDSIISKRIEIISGKCINLKKALNEYDLLCLELHSKTEEVICLETCLNNGLKNYF